jgi:hypothetical protein
MTRQFKRKIFLCTNVRGSSATSTSLHVSSTSERGDGRAAACRQNPTLISFLFAVGNQRLSLQGYQINVDLAHVTASRIDKAIPFRLSLRYISRYLVNENLDSETRLKSTKVNLMRAKSRLKSARSTRITKSTGSRVA